MSLEDRFYPEDSSLITRYDNLMIKSAKLVGIAYQHTTGKSYKELLKNLYKATSVGFGIGTLAGRADTVLMSFDSMNKISNPETQSPLEEEIKFEVQGMPRLSGKLLRLGFSGLGATSYFLSKNILGQVEPDSPIGLFLLGWGVTSTISSATYAPFIFAEYLSLSDMPEPPEKTVFEKAKEVVYDVLTPNPLPETN